MFGHFIGGLQKYVPEDHAAVCAEREFVPPHTAEPQRAGQHRVVA